MPQGLSTAVEDIDRPDQLQGRSESLINHSTASAKLDAIITHARGRWRGSTGNSCEEDDGILLQDLSARFRGKRVAFNHRRVTRPSSWTEALKHDQWSTPRLNLFVCLIRVLWFAFFRTGLDCGRGRYRQRRLRTFDTELLLELEVCIW